jgi:hypothetical protein
MRSWHVEADTLVLEHGAIAVEVPASWAGEVSHQLRSAGPLGPILAVRDVRSRWLFLASPDPLPEPGYVLPPDVRCWRGPERITATTVRWVVGPQTGHSALPSVGAVRCAIRTVRKALV